jgi:CDP-diacylglycerol pyrophosphatase
VANTRKYFSSGNRIKDNGLVLEMEKERIIENLADKELGYLNFLLNDEKFFSRAVSPIALKKAFFLLKNKVNKSRNRMDDYSFDNISEY